MRVSDFEYSLPEELIALHPAQRRDESRMLVVRRDAGGFSHERFSDLVAHIGQGDLLILNDTKVIPARIHGRRVTGGRVEVLLTEPVSRGDESLWRAMVRASKSVREGETLTLDGGARVVVNAAEGEGFYRLLFDGSPLPELRRHGEVPLPPYIAGRRPAEPEDAERYQTVYAERPGSCAAPTAGLHFTPEVLSRIQEAGARVARLTLHVGPGTFLPVRTESIKEHRMHEEWYEIPPATVDALTKTRDANGRIVAVGTTSVRALEAYGATGETRARTGIFIRPGHRFSFVDVLLTNFHLPRSTLLMLVSAFAGTEKTRAAYAEAVARRYRFYSYGDCMLIV